jgi:hypothetical protein
MGVFEQFPYTNTHDLNLDWILKTMRECVAQVVEFAKTLETIPATYETKDNITNKRKLSTTGNFTGTIQGRSSLLTLAQIDSNAANLRYLANQFSDGQTGLVIDGAFFEGDGINRNYNGGLFL